MYNNITSILKVFKSKMFLVLYVILFTFSAYSQQQGCPFGIVNCQRPCGRFTDNNKDGNCDFDSYYFKKDTIVDTVKINNSIKVEIVEPEPKKEEEPKSTKKKVEKQVVSVKIEPEKQIVEEVVTPKIDTEIIDIPNTVQVENKPTITKPRYNIILLSSLSIGFYILTFALYKFKVISKKNHRRIWNVLLLITFLVTGLIGLFLVIQINYLLFPEHYFTFLKWHVDFGIAMALISFFHVSWHLKYYKNIFYKKQKCKNE